MWHARGPRFFLRVASVHPAVRAYAARPRAMHTRRMLVLREATCGIDVLRLRAALAVHLRQTNMSKPQDPASERDEPGEAGTSAGAPAKSRWKRLLGKTWVVLFVVVLIALQFGLFAYLRSGSSVIPTTPEITLGEFCFENASATASPIRRAEFELHVGVLPEVDRDARLRLIARRYKVQQAIEELLRRSQATDFEDPALAELKRQLQEQINTSLGLRSVSEIIITDLKLTRGAMVAEATTIEAEVADDSPDSASPAAPVTSADSHATSSL